MPAKSIPVIRICANPECGKSFSPDKPSRPQEFCCKGCGARGRLTTEERFWSFVDKQPTPDGCWIWKAGIGSHGYGSFRWGQEKGHSTAHRYSFQLAHPNEPIPEGVFVCHTCDNRRCVRPDHLWLGSAADNSRDASIKGRVARGERQYAAKLTEADVRAIRARYAIGGISQQTLAIEYRVSQWTISAITLGIIWRHVT